MEKNRNKFNNIVIIRLFCWRSALIVQNGAGGWAATSSHTWACTYARKFDNPLGQSRTTPGYLNIRYALLRYSLDIE
eukprot:1393883-Amorphochlora_amoeboformis.AAC.2